MWESLLGDCPAGDITFLPEEWTREQSIVLYAGRHVALTTAGAVHNQHSLVQAQPRNYRMHYMASAMPTTQRKHRGLHRGPRSAC